MRIITALVLTAAACAAMPAQAQEKGDVLMRVRAIMVSPNEKSGGVQPSFPGGRVGVTDSYAPEVDFTYMLTDHIGTELILATTKHDVQGRAALSGIDKLAGTWVLPPTLTLQYHFADPHAKVRPYVGAGVNYTIFYSSKASGALNAAIGDTKVHLNDSFGYALQAGVDVNITRKVFANLDIKYIDMDTTARLHTGGALNQVKVNVDPLVFGIGLGLRL
ncbi:OmpW family protein [Sphingomonas sp. NFR15]|uniref:OmpW/AlkL family protein n=1 Tax=Sphingomonas sp. NFR15 TaxID=1566282 RepID=UPI000885E1A6|nr:OmpW family outer membrane protein [Sphingomonas sp. NFR15]SDA30157.1 outer membrane protein [Sphingomonas sp. NFR15]